MCLAAIAIGQSARFPGVVLSNRDEFFNRPALPLAWWQPQPGGPRILSGRDRSAGGTWMGLNEAGQLALVTNVREPGRVLAGTPSRGDLVPQWLLGAQEAGSLQAMAQVPRNGFNFLAAHLAAPVGAAAGWWLSNRPAPAQQVLGTGLHGLSNAALDTPWPKVRQLKQRLHDALQACDSVASLAAAAFAALADRAAAADENLPATGVPLARERQLSPAFIRIRAAEPSGGVYGTRCSTVVVVEQQPRRRVLHVIERSFDEAGAVSGEVTERLRLAS